MALPKLYDRVYWDNNTTPAINEDNLNSLSKAVDDIDDRLIALAGTIMEDVPQIQEDLEILEPAIESINSNVERAETAADGAEESADEAEYWANVSNPPIPVIKDYASVITVDDAIPKAATDVKVKVEAVQDLHGYDKPWVGGAGKNKLSATISRIKALNTDGTWSGNTYTVSNTTFTLTGNTDGDILSIDVNTAGASALVAFRVSNNFSGVNGTTYTLNGCPSGGGNSTYRLDTFVDGQSPNAIDTGSGANFTATSSTQTVRIVVFSGAVISHKVFKPMICLASETDKSFAPYSNICPISGFTEAKIDRYRDTTITYDPNSSGKYIGANGTIGSSGNFHYTNLLPVVQASYSYKYTTATTQFATRVHAYDSNGTWLSQLAYKTTETQAIGENEITFDVDSSVSYIRISQSTEVSNELLMYDNTQYIIDLDGERYGATIDVDSGVMTVDEQYLTIDKDLITAFSINNGVACGFTDGNYTEDCISMCDSFEIKADPFGYEVNKIGARSDGRIVLMPIWGQSATTLAEFKTAMGSQVVNVVYELATPITVQLTPTEVQMLQGYNVLSANSGDVYLKYDASMIQRIANEKLDISTFKSVVASSSDFADFKTKVAAL